MLSLAASHVTECDTILCFNNFIVHELISCWLVLPNLFLIIHFGIILGQVIWLKGTLVQQVGTRQ